MKYVKYFPCICKSFIRRPWDLFTRKNYLFLISHMRSYSSLICHILGSNDQISGYSENHLKYRTSFDFFLLRIKVLYAIDNQPLGYWIIDKILHNHLTISYRLLNKSNVKVIFVIRKPLPTLKSHISLSRRYQGGPFSALDPASALDYYCTRLEQIQEYSKNLEVPSLFLEAEKLFSETEHVLNRLTSFLGLTSKLVQRYMTFRFTGVGGYGDPLGDIKRGAILQKSEKYGDIIIPEEILYQAEQCYSSCKNILSRNCHCILYD